MRTLVIFEDDGFRHLLPLTYWRTISELRTGYGSLCDHILEATKSSAFHEIIIWCRHELASIAAGRFSQPVNRRPTTDDILMINARLLATSPLRDSPMPAIQWHGDRPLIIHADAATVQQLTPDMMLTPDEWRPPLSHVSTHEFVPAPRVIGYPWDLVHANPDMLYHGWRAAGEPADLAGRICEGVHILNKRAVHVGTGTTVKPGAVLDAEHGPIFIGNNATISPNTSIEGPCFIGDGSLIQAGTSVRDAVSIGRRCKVGGELESSILHGFSNKQHDGFLGHAYVAEWVNLAADTVNSDLKNTYGNIRVPINGVEVDSGQMFVGLTIGDHSKTGIGQMFPTGAVVGFGSNIATCDFAPKFVPSFTWLTGDEVCAYAPERGLEIARRVVARRQQTLTLDEQEWFMALPAYARRFEKPMY